MKFVVLGFAFAVFAVMTSVAEEFKCVDDQAYQENRCNNCFCAKGELACSAKLCPGEQQEDSRKCTIGETWKEACNKCWCDKNLGTVCTNDDCLKAT